MEHTFHVKHTEIYSRYICKYLGMFEDVQSLWALLASTAPTDELGHLNYVLLQGFVVNILFHRHSFRLYLSSYHPPWHAMWWKLRETGYLGSSLPELKFHGYFSNLSHILVALLYTFLNDLQSSLYDQNWWRYATWSNRVSGLNLLTSKIIIISLIFYIFW